MDKDAFKKDPRGYALAMVEEGLVDPMTMITACLKYLSHDDVREMLDMNELSPRFSEDEADEDTEDSEDSEEAE